MPEPTVVMWVVELTDCPDIERAVEIGAERFGGVFSSPPVPSGMVRVLIAGTAFRQTVRAFSREVERIVGGSATVVGKGDVFVSALNLENIAEELSHEAFEDEDPDDVGEIDRLSIN